MSGFSYYHFGFDEDAQQLTPIMLSIELMFQYIFTEFPLYVSRVKIAQDVLLAAKRPFHYLANDIAELQRIDMYEELCSLLERSEEYQECLGLLGFRVIRLESRRTEGVT
jgi:hypothetical protein